VTGDLSPAPADPLRAGRDPRGTRLDLAAVKALLGASYVGFAGAGQAEQLAGSVTGTVLPFGYDERLELIADPALLDPGELYFNAGRLDRSMALAGEDHLRLARPRIARIITT
jgi:Ala-tRNA(Pro) deacylase